MFNFNQKRAKLLIMMHFRCLLLAKIVLIYAFSVCKILLSKIGSCKSFWQIPSLCHYNICFKICIPSGFLHLIVTDQCVGQSPKTEEKCYETNWNGSGCNFLLVCFLFCFPFLMLFSILSLILPVVFGLLGCSSSTVSAGRRKAANVTLLTSLVEG